MEQFFVVHIRNHIYGMVQYARFTVHVCSYISIACMKMHFLFYLFIHTLSQPEVK